LGFAGAAGFASGTSFTTGSATASTVASLAGIDTWPKGDMTSQKRIEQFSISCCIRRPLAQNAKEAAVISAGVVIVSIAKSLCEQVF
jgi:hypothetical protein